MWGQQINTLRSISTLSLNHQKAEALQSSALTCEVEPLLPCVGSFSRWLLNRWLTLEQRWAAKHQLPPPTKDLTPTSLDGLTGLWDYRGADHGSNWACIIKMCFSSDPSFLPQRRWTEWIENLGVRSKTAPLFLMHIKIAPKWEPVGFSQGALAHWHCARGPFSALNCDSAILLSMRSESVNSLSWRISSPCEPTTPHSFDSTYLPLKGGRNPLRCSENSEIDPWLYLSLQIC